MSLKYLPKEGTNSEDVQEMNRSLIMRLMRQMPVCSRADLAKATGLKRATITNIVGDLIGWGLVKEVGIIEGKGGRRSIGITINSDTFRVIGLRLARKYFSVGLYDIAGKEYCVKLQRINNISDSRETFESMKGVIKEFLDNEAAGSFLGIGCAIPGPFFRNEGKMALITELTGWEKIPIKDELEACFGLPVYLEHDANLGALAEWWLGSSKRKKGTLVYVAAGQGIGAGIAIEGQVFRGSIGVAGEIGHMSINFAGPKCECGNNGCLTNYCSTTALMKSIKQQLHNYPKSILNENISMDSIIKALEAGDELAAASVSEASKYLSCGLINIIYSYNPDVIIIGDELAQIGEPLLTACKDTVREHILPNIYQKLSINLTSFEKDPVLIGAGALVVDEILSRPSFIYKSSI